MTNTRVRGRFNVSNRVTDETSQEVEEVVSPEFDATEKVPLKKDKLNTLPSIEKAKEANNVSGVGEIKHKEEIPEVKGTTRSRRGKSETSPSIKVEVSPEGEAQLVGILQEVPIDQLKPNPWNYNEQSKFMMDKLKKSIKEFGFVEPITVRTGNEKGDFGFYEIIGGEHRWLVAKDLGMKTIRVNNLGVMNDGQMKKLLIVLNETKGRPNTNALSEIIADLTKTNVDMSVLPYDEAELNSLATMGDFDFTAMTIPDDDNLSKSMGTTGSSAGSKTPPPAPERAYVGLFDVLSYDKLPEAEDEKLATRLQGIMDEHGVNSRRPWEILHKIFDVIDDNGLA